MRPLVLFGVAVLTACAPATPAGPFERPLVVVTIFPVGDLVRSLAGDGVEVEVLLPPRASPATWEATPRQVRLLQRARGRVAVGAGLDAWVEGMIETEAPTLRIAEGIALIDTGDEHGHGHAGDPHVWLDPILVRDQILPRLVSFLDEVVPEVEGVEIRARALADSLTRLDAAIEDALGYGPARSFVATHGGWAYFGRRYRLHSLGSLYERPGFEPSARGLAQLIRAARTHGLAAVLTEPQMSSAAARAVAREIDGEVVLVDPLGGPGLEGRGGYFDLMRFNAVAFASALGADR